MKLGSGQRTVVVAGQAMTGPAKPWREAERELRARDAKGRQRVTLPRVKFAEVGDGDEA